MPPCWDCRAERGAYDCRYLPQIVWLFLTHGFDVGRNGGLAGASCLQALIFASPDPYVIEAEKLLLDAGADPTVAVCDESILTAYDGEACFQHGERNPRLSNFYHTMSEIARAAVRREPYRDIEFFEACIGKRIEKIEMACTGVTPSRAIYDHGPLFRRYYNCFASPILFCCEGKDLCVNRYGDIWVDPNVRERAETVCNIQRYFPDCVGHRITAISFDTRKVTKGLTSCTQPIIFLRLDNARTIRITINFGDVPREEYTAYFSVI